MRIAITGASGFLGSEVVRALSGRDLVLLGRSLTTLQDKFPDLCSAETDYTFPHLASVLDGCDAVIHLAARLYDPNHSELAHYSDNINSTEAIYQACSNLNISNIVFASTRTIYDPLLNRVAFKEDAFVRPTNAYAISKYVCELLPGLYSDLRVKNLRFAQILGIPPRPGFLLKALIDRARNKDDLIVFGTGLGARDYLYVKDVATACVAAVECPERAGVFNVGSNRAVSHLELANAIAGTLGEGQVEVIRDKKMKDDPSIFLMDSSLFMQTFQWKPCFTLEEALIDMKRIYETDRRQC